MRGTASLEALLERAQRLKMTHLAVTEVNGLWGFINFVRLAGAAGIQPICGSHILVGAAGARPRQDLVLLVTSQTGYENLCRLLSRLHDDPTLDVAPSLGSWGRGLLTLCPDPALLERLAAVVPPDALFGELRPGRDTLPLLAACRRLGVEAVSTGEVYFLAPDDAGLHQVLRAIDRNQRLSDLPPWELKPERHHFADEDAFRRRYPHCGDAVDRTMALAARCKTEWDFSATIFPGAPEGEDPAARLRQRVYAGAAQRYGSPLPAKVKGRIEKELRLVNAKGFDTYFLTVADIVGQTRLTIGRGSGAASVISYCLLITQVDPIRHNLAFERFLNPERSDMPDLDVDFAWDERDDILDYVFTTYGTERAAMVANQVTLQPRSAVREVAKVFGLSNEDILTMTKRIGLVFGQAGHPAPRTPAIRQDANSAVPAPSVGTPVLDLNTTWQQVIQVAMRLIGVFHYPSVHAGGVVVVPDEIRRYVPVLKAPKGVQIVEWEKDQVEDSGLVKIDLLGNRSLAVVRDCLRAINLYREPREHLSYHHIRPLDDGKTRDLMEAGRTMGVFYIESPATRQLLAKAGRADYEHVVIYSSIIRPAANRFCNLLVERIRGEPWEPLHPDVDFLNESYGIMVYQEQVAQAGRVLAGFSWSEADMLQKIGTKKSLRPLIPQLREKFMSGSLARGYPQEVVAQLWEMVESFQGYSFTKAHSASYARLSFVCAYLKAHHPAEFMAAVISNRGGYYSPYAYMSEGRRVGLRVLAPHSNRSALAWKGHGGKMRMGFMEIRSLHRASIEALLDERKQGDYHSLADFLRRVELPFGDSRALIRAGAFDELEPERARPELLLQLLEHHYQAHGRLDSDDFFDRGQPHESDGHRLRPLSQWQRLQMEIESFGYPWSKHPLDPYGALLRGRVTLAKAIPGEVGRRVTLAGICLTTKTVQTRKGEPMEFLTFEDQSDVYECVLFPAQYQQFNDLVKWEKLFLVQGRVEAAWGVMTVTIEKLTSLSRALGGLAVAPASPWPGRPGPRLPPAGSPAEAWAGQRRQDRGQQV